MERGLRGPRGSAFVQKCVLPGFHLQSLVPQEHQHLLQSIWMETEVWEAFGVMLLMMKYQKHSAPRLLLQGQTSHYNESSRALQGVA